MRVYTIGHSNHSLDDFIKLLSDKNVEAVADVRSKPFSRWVPHFNKKALEGTLKLYNIQYIYLGDVLGGRPAEPEYYDSESGKVDYEKMKEADSFQSGINRLINEIKKHSVCIMCTEENPSKCHRSELITPVLREKGVEVFHIRGDGQIQS